MKRTVKYLQEIGLLRAMTIVLANGDRLSGQMSESRVDKVNDTEGKFFLDIRHTDDDWTEPATVENYVMVNWFGTLILDEPYIITDEEKYCEIKDYWLEDE